MSEGASSHIYPDILKQKYVIAQNTGHHNAGEHIQWLI